MIELHKRYISWWAKKLNTSNYGLLWISFIKGVFVGLLIRKVVPESQQYGITFWGFNDRDTWIRRFFDMQDWQTIYDENLAPKPAVWGVVEALD